MGRDGASHPGPLFPPRPQREVQPHVSAENALGAQEGRGVVHREDIEEMKCTGITGVSHRLLCYNEPAVAVRMFIKQVEEEASS